MNKPLDTPDPELKSCPFCGRRDLFWRVERYAYDWIVCAVHCSNCGAESVLAGSKEEAAAAWNRRTPQPARPSAIEARKGFPPGYEFWDNPLDAEYDSEQPAVQEEEHITGRLVDLAGTPVPVEVYHLNGQEVVVLDDMLDALEKAQPAAGVPDDVREAITEWLAEYERKSLSWNAVNEDNELSIKYSNQVAMVGAWLQRQREAGEGNSNERTN